MKKFFLSTTMLFALLANSNSQNTSPFWSLVGNNNATGASKLGTTNAINLGLFTNNTEKMRITTSGLVGIATDNPLTKLHVNGAGSFGDNITSANATRVLNLADANAVMRILRVHATNAPAVELISRTSADGPNIAYWDLYAQPTDASFRIRDRQSGSTTLDRLTVLHTNGNVGLGTVTPSKHLHVSGAGDQEIGIQSTSAGAHLWTLQSNGTSDAPATFQILDRTLDVSRFGIDNNGNIGLGMVSPGFPLNFPETLGDKISLYGDSGSHYGFGIQPNLFQIHSDFISSDIAFGFGKSEAFTERMRIKGNGLVGIGTASPSRHLHVSGPGDQEIGIQSSDFGAHQWTLQSNGTAGARTTFQIIDRTAFASRFGIDNSGNIGIGNANPGFPLNFAQAVGDKISLYGNSGSHYGFGIQGNLLQIHSDFAVSDIAFGYGSSASFIERMRIKGDGNVGIGTVNPAYKLSVNGTIQAKEVRVEAGWADYVFEKDYKLASLEKVADYIEKNKHLPGVPSSKEIHTNGLAVGEMQTKLMEKIEELTLYIIDLNARVKAMEKENVALRNLIVNQIK